jgi:hypothetical protein
VLAAVAVLVHYQAQVEPQVVQAVVAKVKHDMTMMLVQAQSTQDQVVAVLEKVLEHLVLAVQA